jgi:hypothetical protein
MAAAKEIEQKPITNAAVADFMLDVYSTYRSPDVNERKRYRESAVEKGIRILTTPEASEGILAKVLESYYNENATKKNWAIAGYHLLRELKVLPIAEFHKKTNFDEEGPIHPIKYCPHSSK